MKFDSILRTIGNTPVVLLNRVSHGLSCRLYAKCEFLNPGGSVKDRIGVQMVEQAEREGRIKPGATLIEASSGNAGIGIALVGAAKGYNVIITMPKKMSREKEVILSALGAIIYRTPTEVSYDHPDSHISLAKHLSETIPNSCWLNQYSNSENTNAHYEYTAKEILNDFGDALKMIVLGVGTGGTVTGIAKRIKTERPDITIVGVDPYGSILGGGTTIAPYLVEGIGYDFFPEVLDNTLVDRYIKVNDQDSFHMAKRLIREEGLLIGGSSGSAVHAALEAAKSLSNEDECLVLLPDGIRNYLSTFIDDTWLTKQKFNFA